MVRDAELLLRDVADQEVHLPTDIATDFGNTPSSFEFRVTGSFVTLSLRSLPVLRGMVCVESRQGRHEALGTAIDMNHAAGTLYVVATPIGNLEDMSPRAVEVLKSVDLIACEDTRHTRKLLTQFSIQTSTTSYHEHNEEAKAKQLLKKLAEGKNLALVSDAGTPLLSDPGFRLVRSCRKKGVPVVPVPGPFAAAAACSVAGLPTDEVLFVGFLPNRAAAQRQKLKRWAEKSATLVIYLAPHRLRQTMKRIVEVLGDREACLSREMTKLHETSYWGSLAEIEAQLGSEKPRGEYTLVVRALEESRATGLGYDLDIVAYVKGLIEHRELNKKEAIKLASSHLGLPKREVYHSLVEDSWH